MKQRLLLPLSFALLLMRFTQGQNNVGIGTVNPDASAILQLDASDKGFIAPRMTTSQRIAIVAPANGLLVYDVTVNCFFYFSSGWVSLCQLVGATGATGPTGAQGLQGATGPAGGIVGPTGPTGAANPQQLGHGIISPPTTGGAQTIVYNHNLGFTPRKIKFTLLMHSSPYLASPRMYGVWDLSGQDVIYEWQGAPVILGADSAKCIRIILSGASISAGASLMLIDNTTFTLQWDDDVHSNSVGYILWEAED